MPHRKARLTVHARLLIVERSRAGWPQARIAEQLGVSRGTVKKGLDRHQAEGVVGLEDRSSRPHTSPHRTSAEVEAQVLELRRDRHRGAVFLAGELGLVAPTVGRILRRHQVSALSAIDPITGAPLRRRRGGSRYERRRPGELLHVDVKKLGRVPEGGGWRLHGRSEAVRGRGNGYDYLHVAVDDHSRLAYIEALPDERDATCAGFLHRAATWFHHQGVTVERVLTTTPWPTAAAGPGPRSASGWASGAASSSPVAPGPTARV
ncbi:leucine zipper domain-containing protein [Actinomycetospora rhizophila]|uniref:Leucine zipper domain-containing protein n=1 Tax=Actinomycetospora rhizophila TaxID=1416876 RepID=A0ABV9ZRV0_9PSEU